MICTLGNFATKLLSGKPDGITKVHGREQEVVLGGTRVLLFPIFHPAAALYTPSMLDLLQADFRKLPALLGQASLVPEGPSAAPRPGEGNPRTGRGPARPVLGSAAKTAAGTRPPKACSELPTSTPGEPGRTVDPSRRIRGRTDRGRAGGRHRGLPALAGCRRRAALAREEDDGMTAIAIDIRPLGLSDLNSIDGIEQRAYRTPWSRSMFASELAKASSICLGAFDDERLIGYIVNSRYVDAWHVMNVAVHPDYQRRGIATRLLERLFDITRDDQRRGYTLEVRVSNTDAIGLYEKLGFERRASAAATTPTIERTR